MKKEKAIDYQFVRPIEFGSPAMKGKIPLRALFKEYLKKLNVGFYDPCCDDDATCPPISQQEFNVIQCKPDGLFVAYQDSGGGGSVFSVGLSMPAPFTITGSPITTSGTFSVSMNGTSSQYLRGDGVLSTFPTIVNSLDEVLAEGGALTTNRTIDLGTSSLNIVNGSSKNFLAINPGTEWSFGDIDSAYFGFKIKIEPRRILLGSETNTANSIFIDDILSKITITSPDTILNTNVTVVGNLKITSGSFGAGKVFTSDSSGVGSWQTPAANYWISNVAGSINNTNTTGNVGIGLTAPSAYLHIRTGNTTVAPLKFTAGGLLNTPADGAVEYDGVNLYFTVGVTRRIFPLGTTNTTIYTGDGTILGPRVIDLNSNSLTWTNTGLFRIVEGDATNGGTYDFNNAVDLLVYNATNSSNLILNATTGLTFEYSNVTIPSILTSLKVDGTGVKLTGIQEFTDNAAAITGGLTAGYLYRTGDTLKIVH